MVFALEYQRALVESFDPPLEVRIGIHLGEVRLRHNRSEDVERGAKPVEVEGLAKPICGRLMSLAQGRQLLLSRPVFDLAQRGVEGQERAGEPLRWFAHGTYLAQGLEEPLEIFQVGEEEFADFSTPPTRFRRSRSS